MGGVESNKIKNMNPRNIANQNFWKQNRGKLQEEIKQNFFLKEAIKSLNSFHSKFSKVQIAPEYKDGDSHFRISSDSERQLFKLLLSNRVKKDTCYLYRYLSTSSFQHIIEEGTITMSSIVSMNDKTECDFANNFVREGVGNNNFFTLPNDVVNTYISSFSTKDDNLFLWNMYASDCEGVELIFENKIEEKKDFILSPVVYAEKNRFVELNYIKRLLKRKYNGKYFQLKNWNYWQYFFKPIFYKEEAEIRLIYLPSDIRNLNRSWVKGNTGVEFPLVKFRLFDNWKKDLEYQNLKKYPLTLKGIKLGPLFPERTTNIETIKERLQEYCQQSIKIKISPSSINNYRGK